MESNLPIDINHIGRGKRERKWSFGLCLPLTLMDTKSSLNYWGEKGNKRQPIEREKIGG